MLSAVAIVGAGFLRRHSQDKTAPGVGVLSFKMKSIDGKDVDLSQYKGKVVLFVNVASKCGLTPQYKGLQALYAKYKDQGLVIIGVPANEFGGRNPAPMRKSPSSARRSTTSPSRCCPRSSSRAKGRRRSTCS